MIQLSRKIFSVKIRRRILRRVSFLSRCLMRLWEKVLRSSKTKSIKYKHLLRVTTFAGKSSVTSAATPAALPPLPPPPPPPPPPLLPPSVQESSLEAGGKDPDLVALKISLLGDSQTGKTSFVVKYVGNEKEKRDMQTSGINLMDKTLYVRGARISYCIWEVGGDEKAHNHIPMACKDSVAILYMFDLTSRCTLNSVISWYHQARKWNQNAIPVLIGTKFDDFIQLPMEMQWTVASQARGYAKALNATLFFSSSTYNINVNKIFKFITAKLFNLPWTVERNLTVGEPIIDF